MASLEKRTGGYRVVFRYAGRKYSRSLLTTQVTAARASVARLEDNLRRIELGLLSPPAGVDLCDFLLADGKAPEAPKASTVPTLSRLCDYYFEQLPPGALEASTPTPPTPASISTNFAPGFTAAVTTKSTRCSS